MTQLITDSTTHNLTVCRSPRGENTLVPLADSESLYAGVTHHLAAGATESLQLLNDSPGIRITSGRYTWIFSATDYLMFRPDGADSTWVPLQFMRWTVAGTVQEVPNAHPIVKPGVTWTLLHLSDPPPRLTSSEASSEPQWTGVATDTSNGC